MISIYWNGWLTRAGVYLFASLLVCANAEEPKGLQRPDLPSDAKVVKGTIIEESEESGTIQIKGVAVEYIEVTKISRCEAEWDEYCETTYPRNPTKPGYLRCKFSHQNQSANGNWTFSLRSDDNIRYSYYHFVARAGLPGSGRDWIQTRNSYFWVKDDTPPEVRRIWCDLPLNNEPYKYCESSIFTPCGFYPKKPWPDAGPYPETVPQSPVITEPREG